MLAQAGDMHFSGYAKSYLVGQDAPNIDFAPSPFDDASVQSQNALRLMMDGDIFDDIALEVHYEAKPVFSSISGLVGSGGLTATTSSVGTRYRLSDINNVIDLDGGKSVLVQNLDRFNVQFDTSIGELTIGRQAIAFGSARMINPTDTFEPFLVSTLDREYRTGIDAVRFQTSFGAFSELDLGVVIGNEGRQDSSALFGRYKTSVEGNDIEAVVVLHDGMTLVGGGVERALGLFGFWLEGAVVSSDAGADYSRFSTGIDRAITDNSLFMIEYHYNGAGTDDPANYVALLGSEPFVRGGVFLLGEHYVIPSVTWTVTPLLGLGGSAFYNVGDDSAFVRLSGEYSLSENLYMDFGTYLTIGKGGTYGPVPPFLSLGSEFGSSPATLYVSLRYYF